MCEETPATTAKATILTWLGKAFSEPDGSPSSRRILFAIAVAYALGLATAALSFTRTLTPEIVSVLETCIWATAAALGVGKFAEGRRP